MTSVERRVDQAMVQAPDGRVEIDSDGVGLGFNLGLEFRPPADLRLVAPFGSKNPATFHEDRDIQNPVLSGRYEYFNHLFGFLVGYVF